MTSADRGTLLVILLSLIASCMSQLSQTSGTQSNTIVSQLLGNYPRYHDPTDEQLLTIWRKALQRAQMMEEISAKRKTHKCLSSSCALLSYAERPRLWTVVRRG
ncbi:hypothetical protein OSTOST_08774 [Ostertagia ostertagi]